MSAIVIRGMILAAVLTSLVGCAPKPEPAPVPPAATQANQPGDAVPPGTDPKLANYNGPQPIPK